MAGTERNRAEREVILHPRKKPLASLEELTEACLPTLTARLWATCCWSATMDGAWKIGDHNFLIAEVRPDPETCLYVQFWSEPHEPVCAEVCSGEWNPGAVKYVRQQQRDRIAALGYTVGGQAGNFQKELQIETSAEAETAAREVLGIFFEVFGYRGQWPLELKMHQGERAAHRPVYSSVTPADFAQARRAPRARDGRPRQEPAGPPPAAREEAVPRESRRPRPRRSASTRSWCSRLRSRRPAPSTTRWSSGSTTRSCSRVSRARHSETLVLSMPLRFDGGVTANWMANAFQHWFSAWRTCERLLKGPRTPRALRAERSRSVDSTVH